MGRLAFRPDAPIANTSDWQITRSCTMILRPTVVHDPFAVADVDQDRYPCPRHRAADHRPGSIWALWTMALWAVGIAATILSVVTFGLAFTPLWVIAIILYGAGVGTLLAGWGDR